MSSSAENRQGRQLRRRDVLLGIGLALTGACSKDGTAVPSPTQSVPRPAARPEGFRSGMTLTSWTTGELGSPEGIQAVRDIAETGANSLALIPTGYQRAKDATDIFPYDGKTSSDGEVRTTIQRAREEHGMTVFLKPHLDNLEQVDGADVWRGFIGDNFGPEERRKWFDSYRNFIVPYAEMAAETGVELFSVGCEFKALSGADEEWGNVVKAVRDVYGGKLTYSAHYEERIAWYPGLDVIGVGEYSPMTSEVHPSAESITDYWNQRTDEYVAASEKFGKPFIFTEIGCSSSVGSLITPWQPASAIPDQDIQAFGYKAALDAFARPEVQESIHGAYWWNWYPNPNPRPAEDISLSPQGKKAQEVFTAFNRQG